MAVSSVSSNLGVSQAAVAATTTNPNGTMNRDDFMKLLVAQLQNQDPEQPADSKELITQLSQLTSVEKLVTMNDTLAHLELGLASLANTQVSGLVGKHVSADTKSVFVADSGTASVPYSLAGRADKVVITLRDADGAVVRREELGSTFPGSRTFTWDGMGADGNRVPVGRYTVEVSASTTAGGPVAASTAVSGLVTSIDYAKGYPEIVIGEARVMLGDVTSIAQ